MTNNIKIFIIYLSFYIYKQNIMPSINSHTPDRLTGLTPKQLAALDWKITSFQKDCAEKWSIHLLQQEKKSLQAILTRWDWCDHILIEQIWAITQLLELFERNDNQTVH